MRRHRLLPVFLAVAIGLAFAGSSGAVAVGQKAPEVTLTGPGNKPVKLSELTAKGPVVMYTFIQAFTGT